LALEAWEVVVIVVIIIILIKPSIVKDIARSLGKLRREYNKGKSG
jgi:Sec-independent protein translocase protein TatA